MFSKKGGQVTIFIIIGIIIFASFLLLSFMDKKEIRSSYSQDFESDKAAISTSIQLCLDENMRRAVDEIGIDDSQKLNNDILIGTKICSESALSKYHYLDLKVNDSKIISQLYFSENDKSAIIDMIYPLTISKDGAVMELEEFHSSYPLISIISLDLDADARTTRTYRLDSNDGAVSLSIPSGTKILKGGSPIDTIWIKKVDNSLLKSPYTILIGENAYDLGPDEVSFDPAIQMVFNYNELDLSNYKESDLELSFYNPLGTWIESHDYSVDTVHNQIFANIIHFTPYAVTVKYNHANASCIPFNSFLDSRGNNRSFEIYVPDSYSSNSSVPLVFYFHGTLLEQNGVLLPEFGDDINALGLKSLADDFNFILVAPVALYHEGNESNNTNSSHIIRWVGAQTENTQEDEEYSVDVLFVNELYHKVIANYNIDTSRVFGIGFDDGAYFVNYYNLRLSGVFDSVAAFAGAMSPKKNIGQRYPVIFYVGEEDPIKESVLSFQRYLNDSAGFKAKAKVLEGFNRSWNPNLDEEIFVFLNSSVEDSPVIPSNGTLSCFNNSNNNNTNATPTPQGPSQCKAQGGIYGPAEWCAMDCTDILNPTPCPTGLMNCDCAKSCSSPGTSSEDCDGSAPSPNSPQGSCGDYVCTKVNDVPLKGVFSMKSFNGKLLVGTYDMQGSGSHSIYDYKGRQISPGFSTTESICAFEEFNGYIYANTEAQGIIYRSSDGINWQKVYAPSLGNLATGCSLAVFNGYIYAAIKDSTNTHSRIVRSNDGVTWNVVKSESSLGLFIREMVGYKNKIYAYGIDSSKRGHVLSSSDGVTWNDASFPERLFRGYVVNDTLFLGFAAANSASNKAGIYKFDGTDYTRLYDSPASTKYVTYIKNWKGNLFAGTSVNWQDANGPTQLLYSNDSGTTWKVACNIPEPSIMDIEVFEDKLYVGASDIDNAGGGKKDTKGAVYEVTLGKPGVCNIGGNGNNSNGANPGTIIRVNGPYVKGTNDILIDFGDSGYSETGTAWVEYLNPGSQNGYYRYLSHQKHTQIRKGTATWETTMPQAGKYQIETLFRATSNRATDSDYILYKNGQESYRTTVDQTNGMRVESPGSQNMFSVVFGAYCFNQGDKSKLVLDGTDDTQSDEADATIWKYIGPCTNSTN